MSFFFATNSNEGIISRDYISSDVPRYQNFRDFLDNPTYAHIGKPIGRLNYSYQEIGSSKIHDDGNCTATIIDENLLLTNAHCVYSPRWTKNETGNEIQIQLLELWLSMDVLNPDEVGDVYAVNIEALEINEELDFAILEFSDISPYSKYGAVDLSNHRSARVGEALYIIHHSFLGTGNNHKRITKDGCALLPLWDKIYPIEMPDGRSKRSIQDYDKAHLCDTEKGSSGSLIYAHEDNAVVGLHFAGVKNSSEAGYNFYIEIDELCTNSAILTKLCYRNGEDSVEVLTPPEVITTVEELYTWAARGGRLQLAATTFELSKPLLLADDVELIGSFQGQEKTRIESSALGYAVRYKGGGSFTARNIIFAHTGSRRASVVQIDGGDIVIDGCTFTGGKRYARLRGSGLLLRADAKGKISNSYFHNNQAHGLQLSGRADFRLENNYFHNNQGAGIDYKGTTAGSALGNYSYHNKHGIVVSNRAQPLLESNHLYLNTQAGLAYFAKATGSAKSNEIKNNLHGIVVTQRAHPTLEGNNIFENSQVGLFYMGASQGRAINNQSYANGMHGVYIQDRAKPELEQNHIYRNHFHGISINEQAEASLKENHSYDNGLSGLYYSGKASGLAVDNLIYNNKAHGIELEDSSQTTIEANKIYLNSKSGLSYSKEARGVILNNEIYGNYMQGITIQDHAQADIKGNRIHHNNNNGIMIRRSINQEEIYGNETYQGAIRDNDIYDNDMSGIITNQPLADLVRVNNEIYNHDGGDTRIW